MRCIAIDWSGRERGAEEFIWIAEARDRELVLLRNGSTASEVVDWLTDQLDDGEPLAVGIDFAFSFPAWFCRGNGWEIGPDVWSAIAGGIGDGLLGDPRPPFWGRTTRRPPPCADEPQMRATDVCLNSKSVFQIGGAGAVGTGSIRGMAHLSDLRTAGFSVWPFDAPARPPVVVEIYPRRLYGPGPVVKSRWRSRHAALTTWFPDHPEPLRERAAGSEDAFDAAVSALRMSENATAFAELPAVEDRFRLEGKVWLPADDAPER